MSVKKEASGRRSVQVEVEVPGTPEEVWQAIATGPGVSSWFVPTKTEDGKDGAPVAFLSNFGPGMEAVAKVTSWQPPQRFVAEGEWAPNAPKIATEWIVEARSGGKCVVRVVHSLFASTDDWNDQLESVESGWPGFFRILRLYLTHFRTLRCSSMQLMGMGADTEPNAWQSLIGPLGLNGAGVGQRWKTPAGVPPMAGVVEGMGEGKHPHMLLLRLDEPNPGIASLGAFTCHGPVQVMISLFLYGDRAPAVVDREQPLWQAWMQERFPMPA